ncbi:MAG: M14 family metallopeptidase [Gemmatimonadaceae bacterium]|nr:M14 family metallopeptidase [Gemmatimonadaceae bacterium]
MMLSRARPWLFLTLVASALAVAPSDSQVPGATSLDLAGVFTRGPFLADQNGDGVIDSVPTRLVLPAAGAPEDVAAAANIAARLGFETSALTPGLAVLDSDSRARDTSSVAVIAVGRSNALVRALASDERVNLASLRTGQGLVAVLPAIDGSPRVVVAGGDDTGTAVAGAAMSARLPYLWQLRGDSIAKVQDDVRTVLEGAGVRVEGLPAIRAVYEEGKERMVLLTIDIQLRSGVDVAVRTLEAIAAAHVVGSAEFGNREADTLNYYGLDTLEVRVSGKSIRIERFGPPYRSNYLPNPWIPAPKDLSLASIFTNDGIFGDSRGEDMIPDESETTIIIGSEAGGAIAAVDLAARIGMEGTGISLPLARAESQSDKLEDVPNPILIGSGTLMSGLALPEPPRPGEGEIRIVPAAFGRFPALVVRGGDVAGVNAATMYFARSLPFLWTPRRGEMSFTDVEEDVRQFFEIKSGAGQAAAAVDAIGSVLPSIVEAAPASLDVKAYLEEGSPETASFVRALIQKQLGDAAVTVEVASRYGPITVFEDSPELGWEVDELRERFTREVLPKVVRGARFEMDAVVSEGPELRRTLEQEFRQAVLDAGGSDPQVRVLSAYKSGYSWMIDYVLPALKGKAVGSISIHFPMAKAPDPSKTWYGISNRWLMELFPVDEILARELQIEPDATTFHQVDEGPLVYRVEVKDRSGATIHTDEYAPRVTVREYFPMKPTAQLRYTTGGIRAHVDGVLIADFNVRTDPERFWDHYQDSVFPRMVEHVREYTGGRMVAENQPYFRDLIFDITMSEPDFRLDLQEERISSLDSLHEDLMFDTIDFWSILSGNRPGSRDVAPGRIMPMIHPVEHGKAPSVKFTFNANASPRPRVVLTWTSNEGRVHSQTVNLERAQVGRPRVTSIMVRSGEESVAGATMSVVAEGYEGARTAARRVERLVGLQEAGAFGSALGYQSLDGLTVSVEHRQSRLQTSIAAQSAPRIHPIITPEAGERIVEWDHVITPDQMEEHIIPRLRSFPEINAYVAGRTYRGRDVWAMDVMLPIKSEIWSQAKASTLKPVLFLTTRVHANEVSAMSAGLRLMELLATDPEYQKYLNRVNIVYRPLENPDGAANHAEFIKLQPTYILHAGYWSSVARDVSAYLWDDDPLLPEALVRRQLYYRWLPDVFMDPHGYPSHEWVHQFAGYKVPWFMAFWIPRGYHINLGHIDDPNYPDHKTLALEHRERIIEEVMDGVPGFRETNLKLIDRFEKYARRYEPDPFRLEIYKGMNILFEHSYSFDVDGPFSKEVYVNPMGGRPVHPEGRAAVTPSVGRSRSNFAQRHPQITTLDLGNDMPDETASGEWMESFAAPGQLGHQRAVLKLLYESQWQVDRFEEDFGGGVRLSVFRSRPVKAGRGGTPTASAVGQE